jgi:hypothetical protein
MGKLLYGTPPTELEVEDRALAHLQVVVVNKFRRGECFAFSLPSSPADGTGRRFRCSSPSTAAACRR